MVSNLKVLDLALQEQKGITYFIASLLFVRFLKTISPQSQALFAVIGVPPWRQLRVRDCYTKGVVRVI